MGKVFITDEVNDGYTADVTNAGKVKVESGAASHYKCVSAAASASVVVSSTPCWLKTVIVGGLPATATCINLYDTSGTVASAAEASGANHIAKLIIPAVAVAATAQTNTYVVPINVYCTSGLTYALGQDGTNMGNAANISITYQG